MDTGLSATLASRDDLTDQISSFTFIAVDGAFEDCDAGAHVDVHLPDGLVRSYSLIAWDEIGAWIRIAVKKEDDGRGGSLAVHDLRIGQELHITGPRNNFPLVTEREPIVLIAGGIGITPIYAMARALKAEDRDFWVHYYVRDPRLAAFDAPLRALDLADRYRLHCDTADGLPDFGRLLKEYPADAHVYVCGPEPMLEAVLTASDDVGGTVFFERFAAATPVSIHAEKPFQVVVNSTGHRLDVAADETILDVLRAAGHDIDSVCTEGVCGTCIVDVVEGEIDHRDSVLTEEDREMGDCMCVCISRARNSSIVLDL